MNVMEQTFPVDEAELVVRLVEAIGNTPRPAGWTAEQAIDDFDPEMVAAFRRGACAALSYIVECLTGRTANSEMLN